MRTWLILLPALALGACSSLPHDGPSGGAFDKEAHSKAPVAKDYALIDLDYRVDETVDASRRPTLEGLAAISSDAPNNQIGAGDAVAVSIYQAGGMVSFTPGSDTGSISEGATQVLPHLVVGEDGAVMVPYAGRVRIAGLTVEDAARVIQTALRGRVINPQVDVSLAGNLTNTVTVFGDVRNVGRVPLSANNDLLLDVLASAGGPTHPPADIIVTVARADTFVSIPLAALLHDPSQNIRLAPHDQVRVAYTPRKYSTFGAFGHVSEQPIEDESLTLAEAISREGGLDTTTANAASVLVFRFERPEVARALGVSAIPSGPKGVPIVYRLDMLKTNSFFIAHNFTIEPGDLVYVPRSDATEFRKFMDLVSVVSQVTYNLTVTPVLK